MAADRSAALEPGARVMTKTKRFPESCPACGSASLFSGWFDPEDLACPLAMGEKTPPGVRWTTFCNDCGEEVKP